MRAMVIIVFWMMAVGVHAAKETHGGGAIVCRDNQKKITKAIKLDFYVGRQSSQIPGGLGLSIAPPFPVNKSQNQNFQQGQYEKFAMDRMNQVNPYFYNVIADSRKYIAHRTHFMPPGQRWVIPNDSESYVVPANCSHEWAAIYQEPSWNVTEGLYRDGEIWSHLDAFNRAGLMLHEAIYLSERKSAANLTSRRTRQVNAAIFSDMKLEPVTEGVPPNTKICIYQAPGPKQKATIYWRWLDRKVLRRQFAMIRGHYVLSKKHFDVDENIWLSQSSYSTKTVSAFEGGENVTVFRHPQGHFDVFEVGPHTAYGKFTVRVEETNKFIINSCGSAKGNNPIHQKALEILELGNGQF